MAASVQNVTCPITIITPIGITVYEAITRILLIRSLLCNLLKTSSHFYFQNLCCRAQVGLTLTF